MEEAVNITILAPTENAFRYFPQSALDSITEDDILYHVLREGGMPALTSSMIPDDVAVMRSTLVRDLDSPALAGLVVREGQLRAIGARGQWANVTQAVSFLNLSSVPSMCEQVRTWFKGLSRQAILL